MKSRIVAILLCLFTGGLGGHKFYLNQNGLGLLYLLFCWTFIPGMIALIELIFLLMMDDYTFNKKFNNNIYN